MYSYGHLKFIQFMKVKKNPKKTNESNYQNDYDYLLLRYNANLMI